MNLVGLIINMLFSHNFSTMPKKSRIRSINAKKFKIKSINIANKWKQRYIKTDSTLLICWLSTLQSGEQNEGGR